MNLRIAWPMLAALFLVLTACPGSGAEKADLVPERRSGAEGPEGFCRREGNTLTVRVRNQSNPDVTLQTSVRVDFGSHGTEDSTAAPMAGGSFSDAQVTIPSGCFDSDCEFSITVDYNNDVDEANEDNNKEEGICIG